MSEPEMDGTASTAVVGSLVRGRATDQARHQAEGTNQADPSKDESKDQAIDQLKDPARKELSKDQGGVLVRVRSLLPEFTGALRRVAEQVLTDPAAASRATIVELAERSGTSPATVTRFCRPLGFDGYADLRLGIAAETGRARSAGWTVDIGREIQPGDPLERVLGQIMAADTRAMHDTAAL